MKIIFESELREIDFTDKPGDLHVILNYKVYSIGKYVFSFSFFLTVSEMFSVL